jgi:LacI family transcriptional regulator
MVKLKRPTAKLAKPSVRPLLKHVALIMDPGFAPRQEIIRGIADWIREHEPWAIYLKPAGVESPLSNWFKDWHGDGIIVYASGPLGDNVVKCHVPIVDLFGKQLTPEVPLVRLNDYSIGRLGAEHLLERGFKQFAFYENTEFQWADRRRAGFEETLRAQGFNCQIYRTRLPTYTSCGPQYWEDHQHRLANWLSAFLPKPIGIMTSTDAMGQNLLEACQRVSIHVPEEVAVIGVDNDETLCRIAIPPLSSVVVSHSQRGYVAAGILHRLMEGQSPPKSPILIEPAGVVARASTDIMAIDDPAVVKMLRVLRERAYENIKIEEIIRAVPESRTALQNRFRKIVGRSIHDEIIRLRLNRAIELLNDTTLEIKAIAVKAGLRSQAYMSAVFRKRLGRTPGSYRSHLRAAPCDK